MNVYILKINLNYLSKNSPNHKKNKKIKKYKVENVAPGSYARTL